MATGGNSSKHLSSAGWRALFFTGCVLVVPALDRSVPKGWRAAERDRAAALREDGSGRVPFDATLRERVAVKKPQDVFIGDSMLASRVDAGVWKDATGRNAEILWEPGSTSARWYLYLKNHVLASGHKPERVFFFFRDRFWNLPELNVDGAAWAAIERAMPDDDPVVRAILGGPRLGDTALTDRLLDRVYPMMRRRTELMEGFADLTMTWAGRRTRTKRSLVRESLNKDLSFDNMRPGLNFEGLRAELDMPVPFTAASDKTFLPSVMALLRESGLSATFVRVERRPASDGSRTRAASLPAYIGELRAFIEAGGAHFIDLSDDVGVKLERYGEGDHIAKEHRAWWTRRFAERLAKEGGAEP